MLTLTLPLTPTPTPYLEVGDGVDLSGHRVGNIDRDDLVVELTLVDKLEIAEHLVRVRVRARARVRVHDHAHAQAYCGV